MGLRILSRGFIHSVFTALQILSLYTEGHTTVLYSLPLTENRNEVHLLVTDKSRFCTDKLSGKSKKIILSKEETEKRH